MYIVPFSEISIRDVARVGGKNASLGEMFNHLVPLGINVPDGFAIDATAYRSFIDANQLKSKLKQALDKLDSQSLTNLSEIAKTCRDLKINTPR